jgi:hypothetical protein
MIKALKEKLDELQYNDSSHTNEIERLRMQVRALQNVIITAGIVVKRDGRIEDSVVIFDGEPYSVLRDRK